MKTRFHTLPGLAPLLVGLLLVTSSLSAHAQVPTTTASCDADDECNRLANEAIDASQAGRFGDAQRAYKAAYERLPDPKLLFNLARVLHKAGQLSDALTYYQKYLDAGAEGSLEQRQKAEQRMEEARREQAAAAMMVRPPPPVQATEQTPNAAGTAPTAQESSRSVPIYRKWWLWTAVSLVAVGAAVGIGLGVAAHRPDLNGYSDAHPFVDHFGPSLPYQSLTPMLPSQARSLSQGCTLSVSYIVSENVPDALICCDFSHWNICCGALGK